MIFQWHNLDIGRAKFETEDERQIWSKVFDYMEMDIEDFIKFGSTTTVGHWWKISASTVVGLLEKLNIYRSASTALDAPEHDNIRAFLDMLPVPPGSGTEYVPEGGFLVLACHGLDSSTTLNGEADVFLAMADGSIAISRAGLEGLLADDDFSHLQIVP